MSVSDCYWHWQDTVLVAGCQRVLSSAYTSNVSVYNVASCDLFRLEFYYYMQFVSKCRTLLHVADVRTR